MRRLGCGRTRNRREVGRDTAVWGPGYRSQKPVPRQPACPDCGGRLVCSVVNSGDPMPLREMMLAERHARSCEPMLGLGSSLLVTPAAALVGLALGFGARVTLVNRGETPCDEAVSLRV